MTDASNHLFIALRFTLKVNYVTKRKSSGEYAPRSLHTFIPLFCFILFSRIFVFAGTESEILFNLEMTGLKGKDTLTMVLSVAALLSELFRR